MILGDRTVIRRACLAAIAGAVAMNVISCAQDGPDRSVVRAADRSWDPIERIIVESEWRAAEMQELAGREPARAGKKVQDASISARVISVLATEPVLQDAEIHVHTRGSIVTLDGVADTPESRARATQLAMNVQGVRSVHNHLVVAEGS